MEFRDPQPRDTWITFAWIAAGVGAIVITAILSPRIGTGYLLAVVLVAVLFLLRWLSRSFGYRCPECNQMFQLTMLGQFTAINMGSVRSVRCPHCGKRSCVKPLVRAD